MGTNNVDLLNRCLTCNTYKNVLTRRFNWECNQISGQYMDRYTVLSVVLCDRCYAYNEGVQLVGLNWWNAVRGLYRSPMIGVSSKM